MGVTLSNVRGCHQIGLSTAKSCRRNNISFPLKISACSFGDPKKRERYPAGSMAVFRLNQALGHIAGCVILTLGCVASVKTGEYFFLHFCFSPEGCFQGVETRCPGRWLLVFFRIHKIWAYRQGSDPLIWQGLPASPPLRYDLTPRYCDNSQVDQKRGGFDLVNDNIQ
eukprot:315239-Amorphochlora_amoeboformis.AAC.2